MLILPRAYMPYVPNHVRPKLRQHSVLNTVLANTVFNIVIPPIK